MTETVELSIEVPSGTKRAIERAASQRGLSVSDFIQEALRRYLEEAGNLKNRRLRPVEVAVPPNQKITLAEMRSAGVRGLLIYWADFRCSHHVAVLADRWADEVRLSDLEPKCVCTACGRRGGEIRPDFHWSKAGCHDGLSLGAAAKRQLVASGRA